MGSDIKQSPKREDQTVVNIREWAGRRKQIIVAFVSRLEAEL